MQTYLVIFDGASHYVIPNNELEDLQNEDEFGVEVVAEYSDIDQAFVCANRLNDWI